MKLEDLQTKKLKIFDHPYLKEPCFKLGLEQREQLKTCQVWQAFQNQKPIPNEDYNRPVEENELEQQIDGKDEIQNQFQAQFHNVTFGVTDQETPQTGNIFSSKPGIEEEKKR